MIEVFKTNVKNKIIADRILSDLTGILPDSEISFDLEDCDRVLRVKAKNINSFKIIEIVKSRGSTCEILE